MGRLIAQKLGEVLSASFVVENRTGASGAIGTQYVAQQAADGYTLLLVASPFTTVAASLTTAGYDPIKSFTPVGMIASGPLVWAANNQLPANTMQELVALARQKPGVLNYGAGLAGYQLMAESFYDAAKVQTTGVPFKGASEAVTAVASGTVNLAFAEMTSAQELVKSGKLRALAVASEKRSPALPQVPTAIEAGLPGFTAYTWVAAAVSSKTPKETTLGPELPLGRSAKSIRNTKPCSVVSPTKVKMALTARLKYS